MGQLVMSYGIIVSDCLIPIGIRILLGSVTGLIKKLVTCIRKCTPFPTSYITRAGGTLLLELFVYIISMVMTILQDRTTIIGDLVSAGMFTCPVTGIIVCPYAPRLDVFATVCLILWTALHLCPRSKSVQNVSARFFCLSERFPWYSGWCMWCWVRCRLLKSWLHQTMQILLGYPSSWSMEWFILPWSALSLQYKARVHLDASCDFSDAALCKLRYSDLAVPLGPLNRLQRTLRC